MDVMWKNEMETIKVLGLYEVYTGTMENRMETTIILGLYKGIKRNPLNPEP